MNQFQTDRDWEVFGQTDPYWSVLTDERYRRPSLTDAALHEFFDTGEAYAAALWTKIRSSLDADFTPATALDFGCGVGRLVLPLARRCRRVVGVDVSPSMLATARQHCDQAGLTSVELIQGDNALSNVTGEFDLITSQMVSQHIPTPRGEVLCRRLLQLLSVGGIGALHFSYAKVDRKRTDVLSRLGLRSMLATLWRGMRLGSAATIMQMHNYNLNAIFQILQRSGVRQSHVEFSAGKRGTLGVRLVFKKERRSP